MSSAEGMWIDGAVGPAPGVGVGSMSPGYVALT